MWIKNWNNSIRNSFSRQKLGRCSVDHIQRPFLWIRWIFTMSEHRTIWKTLWNAILFGATRHWGGLGSCIQYFGSDSRKINQFWIPFATVDINAIFTFLKNIQRNINLLGQKRELPLTLDFACQTPVYYEKSNALSMNWLNDNWTTYPSNCSKILANSMKLPLNWKTLMWLPCKNIRIHCDLVLSILHRYLWI